MPSLRIPPNRPPLRRQGGRDVVADATAKKPCPTATQLDGADDITDELRDSYPDALRNEVSTALHREQMADLRRRRMLATLMIGTVCAVVILLAILHPDQIPWLVLVLIPFLALGGLLTR